MKRYRYIILGLVSGAILVGRAVIDQNPVKIKQPDDNEGMDDKSDNKGIVEKSENNRMTDIDDISSIIHAFRREEGNLVNDFLEEDIEGMTEEGATEHFYQTISRPLQGVCHSLKKIGGQWMDSGNSKSVDGDKFICLDRLLDPDGGCIIYSFGIRDDWTWEDFMDKSFNCSIVAHDPTVNFPPTRGRNIKFFKLGVASEKSQTNKLDTIKNILQSNGHIGKRISYLKMDVEGEELNAVEDWIDSGVLDQVEQIALELHLPPLHSDGKFKWFLSIIKKLYQKKFRLISHEINMTVGGAANDKYYSYLEVVFMKDNVWDFLDN